MSGWLSALKVQCKERVLSENIYHCHDAPQTITKRVLLVQMRLSI